MMDIAWTNIRRHSTHCKIEIRLVRGKYRTTLLGFTNQFYFRASCTRSLTIKDLQIKEKKVSTKNTVWLFCFKKNCNVNG
jgi:hypothetical protein